MEWEGVKMAMPSLDFIRESFLPMGQEEDSGTAQMLMSLGDTVLSASICFSQCYSAMGGNTECKGLEKSEMERECSIWFCSMCKGI